MNILVGDVGGTKTRLAIVRHDVRGVQYGDEVTLPSGEYPGLADLVKASGLLGEHRFDAVCFGVAGPVRDNRCRVTNLPWTVDGTELAADLASPTVTIINDLEAVGWGIDALSPEQLLCLQQGDVDPRGNQSIVAPGTGLGEAFRVPADGRYVTCPSEGSHADFSPADERECLLQRWFAERYGHVSWERFVSGPGIATLHRFIVEHEGKEVGAPLAEAMTQGDASSAIVAAARQSSDVASLDAVAWFLGLLGAEAGNHALKVMATGGVFLAGGIPPKLADLLPTSPFLSRFNNKGRMTGLMRRMPVHAILDERVALRGAAVCALTAKETGS